MRRYIRWGLPAALAMAMAAPAALCQTSASTDPAWRLISGYDHLGDEDIAALQKLAKSQSGQCLAALILYAPAAAKAPSAAEKDAAISYYLGALDNAADPLMGSMTKRSFYGFVVISADSHIRDEMRRFSEMLRARKVENAPDPAAMYKRQMDIYLSSCGKRLSDMTFIVDSVRSEHNNSNKVGK